jgi:IS30 family transposase
LLKLVINPHDQKLTGAQMAYKQLTPEKRYGLKAYMQAGFSIPQIAKELMVHKTTLYREIKRNTGGRGYRPKQANMKALERRHYSRKRNCLTTDLIARIVYLLRLDLSPEQVSGYLKEHHHINISHETIYQYILADKTKGGDLYKHLRHSSKKRKKRYGSYDKRGQIPDRVSIDNRPEIVDLKIRIGDWETDTIIGKNHKGALVTAVERKSKFTCIRYVPNKKADLVAKALIDMLSPFQDQVHTITTDNGKEFAQHKEISKALRTDIYFAHPYHSWERGLNENTNGLIRQYFPKNYSFENITNDDVIFVQNRLNMRPRKSLNFKTPLEEFLKIKVALGT